MAIKRIVFLVSSGILVALLASPNAFPQYGPGGYPLKGTARSTDGKPMEGVAISVRGDSKTFVTTVYTNQNGKFVFPRLEKNKYQLRAQAVGFEAANSLVQVMDNQTDLVQLELKPLQVFDTELSANEWISSIPEKDINDRRMKQVLVSNCTGCHQVGWALQNRFDTAGWNAFIVLMERFSSEGYIPTGAKPNPVTTAYQEQLAAWLGKVRGPGSQLSYKLLPRPTGESARAVITEYDLPRPEVPQWMVKLDGSDWSQGIPTRYAGRASHDAAVGYDGNVYWADDVAPGRTIGKLDPRTGKVTLYTYTNGQGLTVGTHSMIRAPSGLLWMENLQERTFISFDPETEKFTNYPKPDGMAAVGGTIAVDSKSNPWAEVSPYPGEVQTAGAVTLDASTGKYTFYRGAIAANTYGITVDAEDKAWWTTPGYDNISMVDKSGKVSELRLPPWNPDFATDFDRWATATLQQGQNQATPTQKGPRRIAADTKGNYVWAAEFFADQLLRIDMRTKEIKEYPLPFRYSQPYCVNVDKNHMVWINMMDRDAIARFDPKTEKFTEFQLPTRGTEIRHTVPDDSTDPPTIWAPYDRVNKIARIQFRTAAEVD